MQTYQKKSKTLIAWGGPHATFFPEQTYKSELVDFVIKGEGEETLLELVKALNHNFDFKDITNSLYL